VCSDLFFRNTQVNIKCQSHFGFVHTYGYLSRIQTRYLAGNRPRKIRSIFTFIFDFTLNFFSTCTKRKTANSRNTSSFSLVFISIFFVGRTPPSCLFLAQTRIYHRLANSYRFCKQSSQPIKAQDSVGQWNVFSTRSTRDAQTSAKYRQVILLSSIALWPDPADIWPLFRLSLKLSVTRPYSYSELFSEFNELDLSFRCDYLRQFWSELFTK